MAPQVCGHHFTEHYVAAWQYRHESYVFADERDSAHDIEEIMHLRSRQAFKKINSLIISCILRQ
jgi:hypothetical protein